MTGTTECSAAAAPALSELVTDFLDQVWNQGRTDLADRYVAADLIQHNPCLPDGREPLIQLIDGLRQRFPLARFLIRRMAAQGDLVFAHSLFTTGPDDRGIAVIDVFRIEHGLIAEHWDLRESVPDATVGGRDIL
ncbi:nuclear transport factor 2 family protein [Nocardia sp. NPDC088792]|uniref:nuclear transport factor 2 family protein n=1 Tax=Nocardia sp. NPDC088792 TaxID=3364332 RepID=UPI00382CF4DD